MCDLASPSLIGLDWGTSSLRASLYAADGSVLDRRARPWGIQHLPEGGYAAALAGIAGDWRERWPATPVIAAGMVGSRQGWHEVPYVACPADPAAIAAGVVPFDSGAGVLHFAPGIMQPGTTPDVMRGEEAQIIGALEVEPGLSRDSLLVLPGTHCKWAHVLGGRVERFTTYLTGELFAMLRDHSIIGRPARDLPAAQPSGGAAFVRGLYAARESGAAGIAGRLFTTRSLYLTGALPVEETLDYLSGLLVGEEIRSALAEHGGGACPPCVILGDPALCDRYRLALGTFGVEDVRTLDDTGPAGLWRIATAAGLVRASARSAAPAGA